MRILLTKYKNKVTDDVVYSLGYEGFTKTQPIFQLDGGHTLVYIGEKSNEEIKDEYQNLGTSVVRNVNHKKT